MAGWLPAFLGLLVTALAPVSLDGEAPPDLPNGRVRAKADQSVVAVIAEKRAQRSGEAQGRRETHRRVSPASVEHRTVIGCSGNEPNYSSPLDTMCHEAVELCAGGPEFRVMVWYYTREPGGMWQRTGQACVSRGQTTAPQPAAPVVTAEDFRRLPLPAGVVHIQPGNGRTLVNVATNVYVTVGETVIPTTVLGQPVRVKAVPVAYRWAFGDGGVLATSDPGAPYPDLRVTHTYPRPGTVRVVLNTLYRGEYSVAGGAWLPVDGTAEVPSAPVALTVVAGRAELVDDVLPGE